jgi:hypothetical protein
MIDGRQMGGGRRGILPHKTLSIVGFIVTSILIVKRIFQVRVNTISSSQRRGS